MAKAERIEDLGRIREKLNEILDHECFDWARYLKYSEDEIDSHEVRSKISYIEEKLYECLEIAIGDDVF